MLCVCVMIAQHACFQLGLMTSHRERRKDVCDDRNALGKMLDTAALYF